MVKKNHLKLSPLPTPTPNPPPPPVGLPLGVFFFQPNLLSFFFFILKISKKSCQYEFSVSSVPQFSLIAQLNPNCNSTGVEELYIQVALALALAALALAICVTIT